MSAIESFFLSLTAEDKNAIVQGFFTLTGVLIVLFITFIIWSRLWLKNELRKRIEAGSTREEARSEIRKIKPKPRELKLLVWLKYKRLDDDCYRDYLKEFSYHHFGPQPKKT